MSDSLYVSSSNKSENSSTKQSVNGSQTVNSAQQLKQEFNEIIEHLTLTPVQKKFLTARWLEQISWMEQKAAKARKWHFRLRLTSIIGGIILPGLLTLSTNQAKADELLTKVLYWGTFGISQIVAISAATEQLFTYGERWTHYRRTSESLKAQGWQFFELSGPYSTYENDGGHQAAFALFVHQVEDVLQRDVEVYMTQVEQKREEKKSEENPGISKVDSN